MKLEKNKFDFFYKKSKELDKYIFEMAKVFVNLLFNNENINSIEGLTKITTENGNTVNIIGLNPTIFINFPNTEDELEGIIKIRLDEDGYHDEFYFDVNLETKKGIYTLFKLYNDHVDYFNFNIIDSLEVLNSLRNTTQLKYLLKDL